MEKTATTAQPVNELIARRWSPRAYDSARPVTAAQVTALLEAARWAPSCFGDEPWRYLVWNRADDAAGWRRAFDCLAEGNQVWVKNVPLLLLACAEGNFRHNGQANRWAGHDTGAASMSLCLQAVALGLAAHQMGGFDPERARAEFGIPATVTPLAMIAVGYQAGAEVLDGEIRERELAPRQRRPLAENFFAGRWGQGYRP